MLLPSSLIFPFRCSDLAAFFVVEAVVLPDGCCVEASCATAARQIESTSVNSVTPNRFILSLPPSEGRAVILVPLPQSCANRIQPFETVAWVGTLAPKRAEQENGPCLRCGLRGARPKY